MATDVLDAAVPRSLAPLRARLESVRRRRLLARRITAWCAVGVGLLAGLLLALALDRLFLLPRAGRLWLWAGIVAALAWTFRRYAWPHLAVRETEIDVALSMERAHGIDSDFVAALQFERPESAGWGSQTLRSAVVDYVSEFGRQWTTAAPLWSPQLARRSAWAAGLAAIIMVVGVASPGTLRAFVNRMLFGSMHYPTWTRIERLVIAGREIDPAVEGTIRAPIGQPLRIEVGCGGRIPADGRARFTPTDGDSRASVSLEAGDPTSVLTGELANLTESATVEVQAGDAWTGPIRIEAVAAPVVEASLHVEPPAYARAAAPTASSGRQAAVLEGSNVSLAVTCLNKDLERADVVIDGVAHPLTRQPADAPGGRDRFVISGSGSPLAGIRMPVQYEVRAVDVDGLSPDRAPSGAIRIRPDALPQVSAEAITRAVLPTARPTISFTIKDDYGIAAARATIEIVRGDLRPSDAAPRTLEILAASASPWTGDALPRSGQVVLPLADLAVRKGDFVRVVVEAVDHRGSDPGQLAASPPIDLTVTDENGVLQALEASESQAAEELQAIIQEQLGVGEKR